jgi:hypothetical protein
MFVLRNRRFQVWFILEMGDIIIKNRIIIVVSSWPKQTILYSKSQMYLQIQGALTRSAIRSPAPPPLQISNPHLSHDAASPIQHIVNESSWRDLTGLFSTDSAIDFSEVISSWDSLFEGRSQIACDTMLCSKSASYAVYIIAPLEGGWLFFWSKLRCGSRNIQSKYLVG